MSLLIGSFLRFITCSAPHSQGRRNDRRGSNPGLNTKIPTRSISQNRSLFSTMTYRILTASYTTSVYTLEFDPSKPSQSALTLSSSLEVGHHPSWIERHPQHPDVIFTALEQADGRLLALQYDLNTGKGRVIANEWSGGDHPCTLLCAGKEILVGNVSKCKAVVSEIKF